MLLLRAEIFNQFSNILFGFSTKIGLNRQAPFHFNLSLSVGDSEQTVLENRESFYQHCGLSYQQVALQKQVHEAGISIVDSAGYQGESDAMICKTPGIGLAISTADCVPIFIYCRDKNIIAGIHSGWRSTLQRITSKTLNQLLNNFHCNPAEMFVYIGPSISQRNFEVGQDVASQFPERFSTPFNNNYLLDIIGYNKEMLTESGIPEQNIQQTHLCSFAQNTLFHSYRREGFTSGRAYGVIYIKP